MKESIAINVDQKIIFINNVKKQNIKWQTVLFVEIKGIQQENAQRMKKEFTSKEEVALPVDQSITC